MTTTTDHKREEIITKFRDAIAEYGNELDYTIPDNCPGDGEHGTVYSDMIARAISGDFYESFSYDDIETDVLEEIYDNLDIWEEESAEEDDNNSKNSVYVIQRESFTEKYGTESWTHTTAYSTKENAEAEFRNMVDEICQKFQQSYGDDFCEDEMKHDFMEEGQQIVSQYVIREDDGDYESVQIVELSLV